MLNYERVMAYDIAPIEQAFTARDTILYALGVGASLDPSNTRELRFTYERRLAMLPTMPVVLGRPGPWFKDPALDIDWIKMVHGEQSIQIHAPLPSEGAIVAKNRFRGVVDKGPGRGALVYLEREVRDRSDGTLLATLLHTLLMRGDGGCGAPAGPVPERATLPDRPPEHLVETRVDPRAALIYRLSGDDNPLHVDPVVADKAGFERPILHGLATYGTVALDLVRCCLGYDPARLRTLSARFTSPVLPGDILSTSIWQEGQVLYFRTTVPARSVVVLDGGRAEQDSDT